MILTILTACLRFWYTLFNYGCQVGVLEESGDIISGPVIAGNKLPSVAAILIMARIPCLSTKYYFSEPFARICAGAVFGGVIPVRQTRAN
jgi:hypothetical protein